MSAEPPQWQRIVAILGGVDNISSADWNKMTFFQRLKAYSWTKEIIIGTTLAFFLLTWWYGSRANRQRVDSWMKGARPVMIRQFAQVGPSAKMEILQDSASQYTTYATGRKNIESMLARFRLNDRQNIILQSIALVVPGAATMDGRDEQVEVTITPTDGRALEQGVLAVINKEIWQKTRDENWYLTLARHMERPQLLQKELAFMAEHSDLLESWFTPELQAAFENSAGVLRYFAITDQDKGRPEEPEHLNPVPRLHLSFNYPSNEAEQTKVGQILEAVITLVDFLVSKKHLRTETVNKIKAVRTKEAENITKSQAAKKQKQLDEEKAKKRAEAARLAPTKEDEKATKRQQERQARRAQKRQQVRA